MLRIIYSSLGAVSSTNLNHSMGKGSASLPLMNRYGVPECDGLGWLPCYNQGTADRSAVRKAPWLVCHRSDHAWRPISWLGQKL